MKIRNEKGEGEERRKTKIIPAEGTEEQITEILRIKT